MQDPPGGKCLFSEENREKDTCSQRPKMIELKNMTIQGNPNGFSPLLVRLKNRKAYCPGHDLGT